MSFDPLQPIQSMNTDRDRKEKLLVSFDGFIKNQSEGVVRTMLSELEDWEEVYPNLTMYDDMSMEDIYDAVMLHQPPELLYELSGNIRTEEEVIRDLDDILPRIFLDNSKITQFEFALYRLLQEEKVTSCCIFKEGPFYPNEKDYIRRQYVEVIDKIEFVEQTDLPTIFNDIKPTTAFITDPAFVFDFLENQYAIDDPDTDKVMFIVLPNTSVVEFDENSLVYTEVFKASMEYVNENRNYGIAPMFNFSLDESNSDLDEYKEDEDDEEM